MITAIQANAISECHRHYNMNSEYENLMNEIFEEIHKTSFSGLFNLTFETYYKYSQSECETVINLLIILGYNAKLTDNREIFIEW